MRSLGAPHIGDRTEAELISAFADRLHALRPTLVSFNGHGFDLPVSRYRAMVNAIAAPGLSARPYYRRYDDSAVDLCDLLSSFDGRRIMHIGTWATHTPLCPETNHLRAAMDRGDAITLYHRLGSQIVVLLDAP